VINEQGMFVLMVSVDIGLEWREVVSVHEGKYESIPTFSVTGRTYNKRKKKEKKFGPLLFYHWSCSYT
jgi:hypothetical protein